MAAVEPAQDVHHHPFGDMVRRHRLRQGLSQEELATATGIGTRTLRNIELGRVGQPRTTTVRLLAEAFGLTGDDRAAFTSAAFTSAAFTAPAPPTGTPATDHRSGPPAQGADRTAAEGDGAAGVPGAAAVPAQLPRDIATFTGRTGALRQLWTLFEHSGGGPAAIPVISGTAGVGKTTLAVHWAHQIADRFPDGQLYINLQGFGPGESAIDPGEALGDFLTALGVTRQAVPATTASRTALYRSRLAGRRVLVVLDNARDAAQVRPLLPGGGGCLTIITSRGRLTGLVATDGAVPVPLDVLSGPEAEDLLARRLGARRLAGEGAAVTDIVRRCDRLPLALAVVAARAAVDPEARLTDIAEELRHPAGALDALTAGDDLTDVRAVFSWSYRSLPAATRRVFQVLGLHPGPDLDVYAAANLADLPLADTRRALADLVRWHLVTQRSAQRYGLHDLLRAYAAEVAHAEFTESEIHTAVDRLNRFYLHTVCQLRDLLFPRGASVTAPDDPVAPMRFHDESSRHTWVDVERANLVAVVVHGAHHGFTDFAQLMGLCVWAYLYNAGYSTDCLTVSAAALHAARIDGDPKAEANALNHLAGALMTLGRYTETITYGERSLELARLAGDTAGEAKMLGNLAEVYSLVGRSAEAKEYAEAALRMKLRGGSTGTLGDARKNLARLCRQLGLLDEALTHVHAALDAYASPGAAPDRVEALNILGAILLQRGDHDEAHRALVQALTLARSIGHSDTQQCQALIGLGTLCRRHDDLEAAAGHLGDALSIARSAGDPALQADALTEWGLLRHGQGRSAEGVAHVRDALTMATDIGNRRQEALSRNALGELLLATGDIPAARHQFGLALEVAIDIEDPYEQERARAGLRGERRARDGAA